MLPVCVDQAKELFHVREFNQTQLNLFGNFAGKHGRVLFLKTCRGRRCSLTYMYVREAVSFSYNPYNAS